MNKLFGILLVFGFIQAQADIMGDLEFCSRNCSMRCASLVNSLELRIGAIKDNCGLSAPAPAPAPDPDFYKQVYDFAYSQNGINYGQDQATQFADWFVNLPNANSSLLNGFKEVYQFAYSQNGINYGRDQAVEMAKQLIQDINYPNSFECFKKAYANGYSQNGMNLGRDQAVAHARSFCRIGQ